MKKSIFLILCIVISSLAIQAQSSKDWKTKKTQKTINSKYKTLEAKKPNNTIKSNSDQHPNLTGVYTADQKTFYYVRQVGNQVYWYAENQDLSVSEIAYGTRAKNWLTMTRVSTAKNQEGRKYVYGNVIWSYNKAGQNITENSSSKVISKVERRTGKMHFPEKNQAYRAWKASRCNELEGEWMRTDGSTYYTVATNGKLIWFGELTHPKGSNHTNFWTNVFVGDLTQLSDGSWDAEGTFMDVPKGTYSNSGRLKINIKNNRITAYPETPFGTAKWIRSDASYLKMEVSRLKALSDEELDWYGLISVGDKEYGVSKRVKIDMGDGDPNWKIESLQTMYYVEWLDDYNVVKIGVINLQDEDGVFAGEEDDLIDISPIPEATTLELYMDFARNIYVGFESKNNIKLQKVGVAGQSFTVKGDTNASNPGDGMEVGQITIKITDITF